MARSSCRAESPHRAARRPAPGARLPRLPAAASVVLALAASFAGSAAAQAGDPGDAPGSTPRLVAVHHQALSPGGDTGVFRAQVALPPPRLGAWDSVTAETDSGCLVPLGVRRDAEARNLVLDLDVRGASAPAPAPGETCGGTVVLRFRSGDSVEEVAVGVAFHRPAAPAYTGRGLRAQYAIDRIGRGEHGPDATHPPAAYMELSVVNEGDSVVRVVRLAGLAELRRLALEPFVFPRDGRPASLAGLEPITADLDVELAPGETFRLGIVVDPAARISQDAGAAAVQPALVVEEGGELRTLRFDLYTTTWGVDDP